MLNCQISSSNEMLLPGFLKEELHALPDFQEVAVTAEQINNINTPGA